MMPKRHRDNDSSFNRSPNDVFPPTSTTLLDKLRAKDDEAWLRIKHLFGTLVLEWCGTFDQLQRADRQNVYQEVFLTAFKDIEQFRREGKRHGSFRAWLKAITRSKAIDYLRKRKDDPALLSDTKIDLYKDKLLVEPNLPEDFDEPVEETEEEVRKERVMLNHAALEMIRKDYSERDWTIFTVLMTNPNITASTLGEEYGMTEAAVRKVKSRIRKRFGNDFDEFINEYKDGK